MILKENTLTISEWINKYHAVKYKKANFLPENMGWTYWEFNPNRIPLANELIFDLLYHVPSGSLLNTYCIGISETNDKENNEIFTVSLCGKDSTTRKIKIIITKTLLTVYCDNTHLFQCASKQETIKRLVEITG